MQLPDERVDLLIDCVKWRAAPDELMRLRSILMTDDKAVKSLLKTADRRMMIGALVDGLEQKGIVHPAPPGSAGPVSLRTQLGQIRARQQERRSVQTDALEEIVRELNREGIRPLVFKGAVSLLTGEPAWRFQRDLDFAIEPREANTTMTTMKRLGFTVLKAMSARHHHLDCMTRGDLPVIVEPHLCINGPRAARVAGGLAMESFSTAADFGDLQVRLLLPEHALLHGMVHHHFENRGGCFGVISPKGLLEFAHDLAMLDVEATARLIQILDSHPRLRAATELWIAASDTLLRVDPPEGLRPGRQAYRRSDRIASRLQNDRTASIGEAFLEDFGGVAAALRREGPSSLKHGAALAWPLFDSLHNRPWGGRPRALKSAGLLALDEHDE